jgi:two-component system, chemotaxis family, chemotaxis protein CheY
MSRAVPARCLVVDDSRTVRRIARSLLEEAGLQVEEAADGDEAIRRCQERLPDYVLLDWNMPVMGGLPCLREIRRLFGPTTPQVILCTTENDPVHIIAALDAGAQDYIMKPFDRDILLGRFGLQTGDAHVPA